MKRTALLVAFALAVAAIALSGCANAPRPASAPPASEPSAAPDTGPSTTPVPESGPTSGKAKSPGVYQLEGDRTEAIGMLVHEDLEGGFWAVKESQPGDKGFAKAKTLVVLVARDDDTPLPQLELRQFEARYVSVVGTLSEGPSTRMAGPELKLESIKAVSP